MFKIAGKLFITRKEVTKEEQSIKCQVNLHDKVVLSTCDKKKNTRHLSTEELPFF